MTLFLTACGTDSLYNEFDEPAIAEHVSGGNMQTNSYMGGSDDRMYKSPWNLDSLRRVQYHLENNLAMYEGVFVRVTPYIGLAYYDGADDGTYNMPTGFFNLNNGQYPNLYANGQEYGSYVQANPIVLANQSHLMPPAIWWYTHELDIKSKEDHCPLINIQAAQYYNLYGIGFDIVNNHVVQPSSILNYPIAPPPPAGTGAEERLLREYGKVFYYKVEFGSDPYNFDPEVYYVLALETSIEDDLPLNDDWTSLNLQDHPFDTPLYFNDMGGTGTKEIVANARDFIGAQPNYMGSGESFVSPIMDNFGNNIRTIYTEAYLFPLYQLPSPNAYLIKPGAEPHGVRLSFD